MTESRGRENVSDITVRDIRERAAGWLVKRRDHDDWSERDQVELDGWLEKSSSHMVAYLRVDNAWRRVDRLRALRRPTHEKRRIASFLKIAAALSVVVTFGAFIAGNRPVPREQEYATQIGGHETLKLDDGSRIELNTNTRLRTNVTSRARTVWLDSGEAYFQIRHDSARPFVVYAAGHRMTDLGTRFLVRSDAKRVQVALIEGEVRFEIFRRRRTWSLRIDDTGRSCCGDRRFDVCDEGADAAIGEPTRLAARSPRLQTHRTTKCCQRV